MSEALSEGIDRAAAEANSLPVCEACGKRSDGSRVFDGRTLCGTHWDLWLHSPERATETAWPVASRFVTFVERLRAEIANGSPINAGEWGRR